MHIICLQLFGTFVCIMVRISISEKVRVNVRVRVRICKVSFLYRKIYSRADSIHLRQDLDQLAAWERTWLMSFNPSKCQLLRITKRRSPIQYDYTLHGHVLEQVSTEKYLGLNLHEQLSWNFHTDVTAKKANKTRSFIARNVHSLSQEG